MSPLPSLDQVRSLPRTGGGAVRPEWIDENGHMNITHYVSEGGWAIWELLGRFGAGQTYIDERGLSFFTVGHHIDYLGELRLGEEYAVHCALVEHTDKAVRAAALVLDTARDRLACRLEATLVHVSMEHRRATPMPDDVLAGVAEQVGAHPWLSPLTTGLSLRR